MTIAEEIISVIATIVNDQGDGVFSRNDIRNLIGVDSETFVASYGPNIQGMRIDHPGGAPPIRKDFQGILRRIEHGKYVLTPYGRLVVLGEGFSPHLLAGQSITNDDLSNLFLCGVQGGMRRSHRTNTLVLVSDKFKSVYQDKWIDNVFHYTGMGLRGDQELDKSQNKTLFESNDTDIRIYLFEVLVPKAYTFMGEVRLVAKPYQENQLDEDENARIVWIFPLGLVTSNTPYPVKYSDYEEGNLIREKPLSKYSVDQLRNFVNQGNTSPGERWTTRRTYDRNPYVIEYTKRRANGICELCKKSGPFIAQGLPFLEVHHIVWLSKEGDDSIENTVGLCPNCHRKMHQIADPEDIKTLVDVPKYIHEE